ncbi:MAG: carbohydrate ABC transporter permease [Clostridia bacterium]|nr:carbohydrate ABC transporter permease [Clostridia bacterium]
MKKLRSLSAVFLSLLLCAICVVPFLYVLIASFKALDGEFTLKYYYEVFVGQSQYLFRFWKSMALSICISLGQVVLSALAGYGFAKYKFKGKNVLFFILIILMILPLQVTLIPNYVILEKFNMINTYFSLILPALVVPLGTFIMTQSYKAIPNSVIDAARLDGCRLHEVLLKVVIPIGKNALICTFLLSFLDAWNMVEQPITYLGEFTKYPIAVALASVPPGDPTVLLVACVLVTIPPLCLFAFFNRELTEGIALGGEH